jgi:hypothetical protein
MTPGHLIKDHGPGAVGPVRNIRTPGSSSARGSSSGLIGRAWRASWAAHGRRVTQIKNPARGRVKRGTAAGLCSQLGQLARAGGPELPARIVIPWQLADCLAPDRIQQQLGRAARIAGPVRALIFQAAASFKIATGSAARARARTGAARPARAHYIAGPRRPHSHASECGRLDPAQHRMQCAGRQHSRPGYMPRRGGPGHMRPGCLMWCGCT